MKTNKPPMVNDWDQDYEPDYEPYDYYNDTHYSDDAYGYSHSQQSWIDKADYAQELYERGSISKEQRDEIRMGA